jgi:hypothetical protein
MDIRDHNRMVWDKEVECRNKWTVPVSDGVIAAAKQGQLEILLKTSQPIPRSWFPDMEGLYFLCLASGGGQQGSLGSGITGKRSK